MISDRGNENSERNYKMLEELAKCVYVCNEHTDYLC